jgi:hypothetical protein
MNLQGFVKTYLGKTVDVDGNFGGQCVDLFRQYCIDIIGIPYSRQNPRPAAQAGARLFYEQYENDPDLVAHFEKAPNTPAGIPLPGDVVFWNRNVGAGYGHAAIFLDGDVKTFYSLDQNWPTLDKVTITRHGYSNVSGWLWPRDRDKIGRFDFSEFHKEELWKT